MSVLSTARMTSEQFVQMGEDPPGIRLELVNGEIVMAPSASPEHSDVLTALIAILRPYIMKKKLGRLLLDTDTRFDRFNTRRPDLGFIAAGRAKIVTKQGVRGAPDLCVEIVSPGSEKIDRDDKFELFERFGVRHYWIFDPARRRAEAFELVGGTYELAGRGSGKQKVQFPPFADLTLALAEIWPMG